MKLTVAQYIKRLMDSEERRLPITHSPYVVLYGGSRKPKIKDKDAAIEELQIDRNRCLYAIVELLNAVEEINENLNKREGNIGNQTVTIQFPDTVNLLHLSPGQKVDVVVAGYSSQGIVEKLDWVN